jgi:hypothetical protein
MEFNAFPPMETSEPRYKTGRYTPDKYPNDLPGNSDEYRPTMPYPIDSKINGLETDIKSIILQNAAGRHAEKGAARR